MLVLPKPKTMTYGLNSVSNAAARHWNLLPDSFRRITSLKEFRHSLFTHTVALQSQSRTSDYSLIGTNVLVLPKPKTMTYGLNSVNYAAARHWNSLPDSFLLIL